MWRTAQFTCALVPPNAARQIEAQVRDWLGQFPIPKANPVAALQGVNGFFFFFALERTDRPLWLLGLVLRLWRLQRGVLRRSATHHEIASHGLGAEPGDILKMVLRQSIGIVVSWPSLDWPWHLLEARHCHLIVGIKPPIRHLHHRNRAVIPIAMRPAGFQRAAPRASARSPAALR